MPLREAVRRDAPKLRDDLLTFPRGKIPPHIYYSYPRRHSVESANALAAFPAPAINGASCHDPDQVSPNWLLRWRNWIIVGLILAAGAALAVGQHWLALADLLPLLYLLPCAGMMAMCMKGMKHGQQPTGEQTAPVAAPTSSVTENPS